MVTNGQGIESPGLPFLVEALVQDALLDVPVCAPQSTTLAHGQPNQSFLLMQGQIGVCSFCYHWGDASCVFSSSWWCPSLRSLRKSCRLRLFGFIWATVFLVKASFERHRFVACISLNWKKNLSSESDLKDAVTPSQLSSFKQRCQSDKAKSMEILFKLASCVSKQASFIWHLHVQPAKPRNHASTTRKRSLAGAARQLNLHKKNEKIESVGVAGKPSSQQTVKRYFKNELQYSSQKNRCRMLKMIET
ncbi:hypothetical protein L6164_011746 [Bauhinia variegata]|uniref:Uncharacterized protein n=1 Tax=Bauhinia variegata TaxID=167791 RepID=A0ACB9P889_BAUVA|nr:hypothetical protein L6164_011746 [Bauhinia variegata]